MQQLERRRIRPLQVLEDEEQGALRGESRQKLREIPQQSCLELGWITTRGGTSPLVMRERREKLRQVCHTTARQEREHTRLEAAEDRQQRVGQHGVRNAGLYGIRAPRRDREPALRRLLGDGGREPRLTDAAFAHEKDGASLARFRGGKRDAKTRHLADTSGERQLCERDGTIHVGGRRRWG